MAHVLTYEMLAKREPPRTAGERETAANLRCLAVLAACASYLRHLAELPLSSADDTNPAYDELTFEMSLGVIRATRADGDQLLADVVALAQQLGLKPEALCLTSQEVN